MGIFGWSYPPGCNSVPGDEPEGPCEVCGQDIDNCICPVCPMCGVYGDPHCYQEVDLGICGGLFGKLTVAQMKGREEMLRRQAEEIEAENRIMAEWAKGLEDMKDD